MKKMVLQIPLLYELRGNSIVIDRGMEDTFRRALANLKVNVECEMKIRFGSSEVLFEFANVVTLIMVLQELKK